MQLSLIRRPLLYLKASILRINPQQRIKRLSQKYRKYKSLLSLGKMSKWHPKSAKKDSISHRIYQSLIHFDNRGLKIENLAKQILKKKAKTICSKNQFLECKRRNQSKIRFRKYKSKIVLIRWSKSQVSRLKEKK